MSIPYYLCIGASSVMIARAAEWNVSIFRLAIVNLCHWLVVDQVELNRKEGLLRPSEVAKAFLRYVSKLWLYCLRILVVFDSGCQVQLSLCKCQVLSSSGHEDTSRIT